MTAEAAPALPASARTPSLAAADIALIAHGGAAAYVPFSPRRTGAMVMRHWFLLRSSWPRMLELIYWPTVQMLMWGFLQLHLVDAEGLALRTGAAFIGAVLLWDVLFRGQLGFSISFLEEMWARNVGNLLMSPLRPFEFVAALMTMSLIRLAIGMVPVTILAILIFDFNVWSLGFGLAAFFANLMLTGWAIGLVVAGLVLRNGLGAENLAWSIMFLLLPLAAVYYPAETLPDWLEWLSWCLPPTYVFEGMRAIVIDGTFRADLMGISLAINVALIAGASVAFVKLLAASRRVGALLQAGE